MISGDVFQRLLPQTWAWAALQAVREAARRCDAEMRARALDADDMVGPRRTQSGNSLRTKTWPPARQIRPDLGLGSSPPYRELASIRRAWRSTSNFPRRSVHLEQWKSRLHEACGHLLSECHPIFRWLRELAPRRAGSSPLDAAAGLPFGLDSGAYPTSSSSSKPPS